MLITEFIAVFTSSPLSDMGKNFVTQDAVFNLNVEQKLESLNYLSYCIEENLSREVIVPQSINSLLLIVLRNSVPCSQECYVDACPEPDESWTGFTWFRALLPCLLKVHFSGIV